jgi:hypothetical protein
VSMGGNIYQVVSMSIEETNVNGIHAKVREANGERSLP